MAAIDRLVEVFITKSSQQIDVTSFSIPLLLTEHTEFPERVRSYGSLASVAEDFGAGSVTYTMALRAFGQQLVFPEVLIGRKDEDETYVEALLAIQEENDNFIAVVIDSHDPADVLEMASTIQAMDKVFFTSSDDEDIKSPSVDNDIGSQLRDASYDHTVLIYSAQADTQYPEAAWIYQLLETPGSNTWAMKRLSGVTVDRLSDSDVNALEGKNVNYFRPVKGVPIMMTGTTSEGTWIDEVIFVMWWKARVQEAIFTRMIQSRKIPYTSTGASLIEAEIRNVNALGIANGGIADSPSPTVISPNVLAIPESQRASRVMGDFLVDFRLSGGVHKVSAVRATISV